MGAGADNLLNRVSLRRKAGRYFEGESDDRLEQIENQAQELAMRDQMPFDDALAIKTGNTRSPYGSLKNI